MMHLLHVAVQTAAVWLIPVCISLLLIAAIIKKVPVYETFVEGAKDGLHTTLRIAPYLLAMLFAIRLFEDSGAMYMFLAMLTPITQRFNIPSDILPLAVMRPLSGSGSLGLFAHVIEEHGPDSFTGLLASTIQGSTETTFYVLTVYFGAIGVRHLRHTVIAGIGGDLAAFCAAVALSHALG